MDKQNEFNGFILKDDISGLSFNFRLTTINVENDHYNLYYNVECLTDELNNNYKELVEVVKDYFYPELNTLISIEEYNTLKERNFSKDERNFGVYKITHDPRTNIYIVIISFERSPLASFSIRESVRHISKALYGSKIH